MNTDQTPGIQTVQTGLQHVLIVVLLVGLTNPALAADTLSSAVASGTTSVDLRLRIEGSEQDNDLKNAAAETLRTRLGLTSAAWRGLTAHLEFEGTASLGTEQYNSGPGGNGQSQYSVIADPTGTELNQVHLSYAVLPTTQVTVGRQRLVLDDARFVGNVGWRQNEQTFDAVLLRSTLKSMKLTYGFVGNANTIFYSNNDMRSHLLNLKWEAPAGLAVTAYAYWLDREAGTDSRTVGLRLTGKKEYAPFALAYLADLATQAPYADAADSADANYQRLELSLARSGLKLTGGHEVLGGDGQYSFSTPLATLHKFNGWADLFLATPLAGLTDSYVKFDAQRGAYTWGIATHKFGADQGGADYGSETNVSAAYRWPSGTALLAKFADYRAKTHAVDTRKFWIQLSHRF